MQRQLAVLLMNVLAVTMILLPRPSFAQSSPKAGTTWDGIYSEAQADRGKEKFTGLCRRCHNDDLGGSEGGPALRGDRFMSNWELRSLSALFAKARDTMPPDSPSSMSDEEYLDVITHILRANKFPAGSEALKLEALESISIQRTAGETPHDLPNFALVRVVGCLTQSAGTGWTLSQATDPVPTADQPSTAQVLKEAAAQPLGANNFRLVSVASFTPESHAGHKIQAKGLLYSSPEKRMLNVIALDVVATSCGN
jgi:S-disulfanyl-L-cysteine oxidoreductase SoxD